MLLTLIAVMASCNDNDKPQESESSDTEATSGKQEEKISVIRFVDDIKSNTKITDDMLEIVSLPVGDIPINAIKEKESVVDKYITVDVYKGEFVFAGKLSAKAISQSTAPVKNTDYLIVTDYVSVDGDVTAKLQKLINDNSGRTIYFPDGKYIISKPLEISADPQKKVSLSFSNYAVLTASSSWSGEAMIRIGSVGAGTGSTNTYIMGGIIDANSKATAISVEGGRDIFISNVTIRNTPCGIKIASGTAYTDVEAVHISGTGNDAVALNIAGNGNTFTSMRLSGVGIGVEVSGKDNTFRNVFATYSGTSNSSTGFYDKGGSNSYDMCTSVQFANGFRMSESTSSAYSGCHALWNNDTVSQQYGFVADGKMNSVIRNCIVDTMWASADSAFLKASTGGTGHILYPILNGKANLDDTTYQSYRKGDFEIAK